MNTSDYVVHSVRDLESMKPPGATAQLKMLGEYDPEKELIIEDPYYVSWAAMQRIHSLQFNVYVLAMFRMKSIKLSSIEL